MRGSQNAVPATNCPLRSSPSATPATKSALRGSLNLQLNEVLYLSRNLQLDVHKVLRAPRNLHIEGHRALCLPRNLHIEGHRLLYLPRNLHFKVHQALHLPRNLHFEVHQVLRLPRTLHFEVHKVLEICTSRFTKCCTRDEICTCHEICTSRVTECFACHKICKRATCPPATKTAFRSKTAPIPCTCHEKSTLEHQNTRFPWHLPRKCARHTTRTQSLEAPAAGRQILRACAVEVRNDDVERHECTVNSSELAGHACALQRSKHVCFSLTVRTPQCAHTFWGTI